MGVFSSDGVSRAQRKAEAKALKAKAKLEAKLDAKERRRTAKQSRKVEHKFRAKELKAERKNIDHAAKARDKIAKAEIKTTAAKAKAAADARPLSPTNVKRYLTVARLVSPIVVPIAYRAAVGVRGRLTEVRASRAGVPADVLRQFSGHGATLAARIATSRSSVEQVAGRDRGDENQAFVKAMTERLDNLAVAVDTAESMPPGQRRTAHQAIENELAAIDADVLARLGVRA
ncbi:DUF6474 family protein [Gordonia soli]|uniref:Uncharacterized protein n=1 Tax=Gordonia soli NBRC 108243 TaxID=1223545 RepID=M0QL60_9ACTN|nr:DUF6474 family protein [Gordonia soli]GAC69298.1 hypothetical protein GS4_23_00950 [Gordonia soli NBRC 108243]